MNEYLIQILWLLAWPALIIVSYLVVKLMLKRFEKSPYSKSALQKFEMNFEEFHIK
jgi:hypothetical protein